MRNIFPKVTQNIRILDCRKSEWKIQKNWLFLANKQNDQII